MNLAQQAFRTQSPGQLDLPRIGRRLARGVALALCLGLSLGVVTATAQAQACSGDVNRDGRVDGVDLAAVLGQWGSCPAEVSSVTPGHGSVLGGTVLDIEGSGFSTGSTVRVGGALCTAVQVLSSTQMRATTPPGTAGLAPVEVTTPAGTALAPTAFTYVIQAVTSVTPTSGGFIGGTSITIAGQFLGGTTSVTIGGVPVTNLVVVDSGTLTAVTPAGSVGVADLVVSGAKGSLNVPGGFTYVAASTPPWATVIEAAPDPTVVTNASLRNAIAASGWAWRVRDNSTQIEMLLIPAGTFNMGCSASTTYACAADENPVHPVTISTPFYIGRYEVTQAQWIARMGSNPSYFQGLPNSGSRPVEQVPWIFVQSFVFGTGLRLPTEAEWEYAYRAGTSTAFHSMPGFPSGTNSDSQLGVIAWFNGNSGNQSQVVGLKAANGFGLHDMSGNVWEWVNDWYSATYYASSPSTDPQGPTTGSLRAVRGGAYTHSTNSRASFRLSRASGYSDSSIGFRVARNP
jgi:formylglycine-generating enzyme required for sulfatase activity